MEFEGKIAIVTGAGGGLGRAIALGLATQGAAVAIVDVKADLVEETRGLIEQAGGAAEAIVIDITRKENCVAIVDRTVARFGRLDILVNNAGIIRFGSLDKVTEEDWDSTLAVNVSAPFYLIQAAMPHLVDAKGAVVNVCSNAALHGQAYTAAYCASKAALLNLTHALAMEFMHQPVRINAVAPGAINTAMAAGGSGPPPEGVDFSLIARYTPLRLPYSEPEHIAAVVLFLASEKARAVHGACFTADQGMMAG